MKVMSSDSNKEHESLACGAMCFLSKPINPTDLPKIYQVALTCKRNDKSVLWTEHNHRDTDVIIPQQIQLLPEQANVMKSKTKRFSSRSGSRSVNSSGGSYVSTDGSGKNRKRKSNDGSSDDLRPLKKPKIKWTDCLHDLFLQAVRHIGLDKAVPKKILEFMNLQYLTRENIASHLQKYRIFLRKVAEQGFSCSRMLPNRGIDSIFLHAHLRDLYNNNYTPSSWSDTSINNRSFYSKPIQGYGQSRLLSNTAEPVRFNQMSYNLMNRSCTYEPRGIGPNLTLPTQRNLSLPIQPSPDEGRRSLFEPTVMANTTGQTSQVMGFGQHGMSAINGNSFNNNTMSSYGSLAHQPGMSSYGSSTSHQPHMSSHGSLTPTQPGMMRYGNLTPSQPGVSIYENSTSCQPGMNNHGSLIPNQLGVNNYGSLTPNQPGTSSYGISTSNQQRMNNHGSLTPDQHGMSSYRSLTSNQLEMSSHGRLYPNQPGVNSYGSVTCSARVNNYESLTPNQPGPSNFSYGMQLLNNENTTYKPQPHYDATTQPNLEIPQLENLSLCDYLGNTGELPCDISNFLNDHNKQQEEAAYTNKFELPANFETELNQIFSLEENGDGNLVNINQGHSDGETSNIVAAPETNSPILINMNPNHEQEQDVADFVDWSSLDPKDFANEYDFIDSLLNSDMN
ncbi:putative two-component response regulator ARR21 [Hirschfeldia incana]|nr:putative two-component response regulator ARR21 [Hirschfeldia incana]